MVFGDGIAVSGDRENYHDLNFLATFYSAQLISLMKINNSNSNCKFRKYILNAYYVLGITLGAMDSSNMTKFLTSQNLKHSIRQAMNKEQKIKMYIKMGNCKHYEKKLSGVIANTVMMIICI